MNDRFKFRIFSKTVKKFIYFNDSELCIDRENMGLLFRSEHLYMGNYEELQQSTGLKDKNGKLIYEGDIVKQGDAKYVVNWLEGTFCFKGLKTLHNFTIEYVMPSKQEVIGNIYENKDLLNENS